MAGEDGQRGERASAPVRLADVTHWALWALPGRVAAFVLLVDVAALGVVPVELIQTGWITNDLLRAAVLIAVGVLHTEIAVGVERVRRQPSGTLHVDLTS